jgi:hypothetical protein
LLRPEFSWTPHVELLRLHSMIAFEPCGRVQSAKKRCVSRFRSWQAGGAFLVLIAGTCHVAVADKLILRIRAGNPIEKPQQVQIKSPLPARVTTNNILNLSGLDLGYDVNSDTYYVQKTVELGPKEILVYDVELEDIWTIRPDELEGIRQRSKTLSTALKGKGSYQDAERLRQSVEQTVDMVLRSQKQNSIASGAQPVQHIRAYEENIEQFSRAKKDVVRIENLAIAAGIDPGTLIVPDTQPGAGTREDPPPEKYKTAAIRITAQNTSPTEARKIYIGRNLPPEIGIPDILDAGGLEVKRDPKTGNTYVYRERVEIKPMETLTFEVKIRDKWNIHSNRLGRMSVEADELLKKIAPQKKFKSIEDMLSGLIAELKAIQAAKAPAELNEKYVAFYREEGRQLDDVATKLERIKALLKPVTGQTHGVGTFKPPTPKTTWLIIWGILAYLALMTIIVMVRWMVRSKADKSMESRPPSA